jgi:hypothetical protein
MRRIRGLNRLGLDDFPGVFVGGPGSSAGGWCGRIGLVLEAVRFLWGAVLWRLPGTLDRLRHKPFRAMNLSLLLTREDTRAADA